jgi:hypothetical protein
MSIRPVIFIAIAFALFFSLSATASAKQRLHGLYFGYNGPDNVLLDDSDKNPEHLRGKMISVNIEKANVKTADWNDDGVIDHTDLPSVSVKIVRRQGRPTNVIEKGIPEKAIWLIREINARHDLTFVMHSFYARQNLEEGVVGFPTDGFEEFYNETYLRHGEYPQIEVVPGGEEPYPLQPGTVTILQDNPYYYLLVTTTRTGKKIAVLGNVLEFSWYPFTFGGYSLAEKIGL